MTWRIEYADDKAKQLLFEKDGSCVQLLSTAGDLAEYQTTDGRRELAAAGDLVNACNLSSVKAVLRALQTHGFDLRQSADVAKFQGGRMLVRFQGRVTRDRLGRAKGHEWRVFLLDRKGRLCKRAYKRGGRVPLLAPVSLEDAVLLATGAATIRYTRGNNRFTVQSS